MGQVLAQTSITGSVTTPQNVADSVVDIYDADIDINTTDSENAAVIINSSTTATVTIENVTINSTGLGWGQEASPFRIEGDNGVNVQLTGTNTITLVSSVVGGSGLIASTGNGAGDVSIGIAGVLNVSNNSAGYWPDNNHGLSALAKDGNVNITHTGTGKIETIGGNAVMAFVSGNTVQGNAIVTLQGAGGKDSIELETSGGLNYDSAKGNHGISAFIEDSGNITGQVQITADAKITTTGGYADGIRAQAQGGAVTVKNSGTINVAGDGSSGINAVNKNGEIHITNSGDIVAGGSSSKGINATTAGGNIYITNTGNIASTGNGGLGEGVGILADSRGGAFVPDGTYTGTIVVDDQSGGVIKGANFGIFAAGGDVTVKSNSDIEVQFTGSNMESVAGIDASAGNITGNAYVEYDGSGGTGISVSSSATNSNSYTMGIFSSNKGTSLDPSSTGNAKIIASSDINVEQTGGGSTAFIYGIEANTYGVGDAIVHYKSGTINIELKNGSTVNFGHGIVLQGSGSGNLFLRTDSRTAINTVGDNITGVYLLGKGTTPDTSVIWGNINSTINTNGTSGHGIWASAENTTMVELTNLGNISTQGAGSKGIYIDNGGSGKSTIINSGVIKTQRGNSHGIYVQASNSAAAGTIQIANDGDIETAGQGSNAIHAFSASTVSTADNIVISNTGDLKVADAMGIYAYADNGNVTVINTDNITTAQATGSTQSNGIYAESNIGKSTVLHDQGTIKVSGNTSGGGSAIGILAGDGGSGDSAQETTINLGSHAVIDATLGVGGLQIQTNGKGNINIASGAKIHGGSGFGVNLMGTGTNAGSYEINNAGVIDSVNDRAILTGGQAGSTLTVNNYGTITGYIDSAITEVTFNNYSSNSLNLRNYYDSDADGVADTKAVSISTFGGGTFNNTATGAVRLLGVNGEHFTDTTGEYVPPGAFTTATAGIVQAQLLNLATFDNAGEIDLTASGKVGDVLVISGSNTAGTYGGGQYVSNGGSLKLDTVLTISDPHTGTYISQSDILVVDDARLGNAPTRVYINSVAINGYQSGITQGDGIQIVEVLGNSDMGAFSLGAPVTYDMYEFTLGQGTGVNAQSWYLRNADSSGQVIMNPNAGAYLANQYAAATMFNHNILDRRESVRNADNNIWFRLNNSDGSAHLFDGRQEVDIQSTLIQVGADLLHKDNVTAGVYGGYGHSQIDNRSRQTGSSADGKVDGYHLGAYVSWLPNEDVGPYADAWTYYAWFDNKLQGQAGSDSYDGTGYAFSLEGGYGFELAANEDGSAWIFKPHAQIIYTHVDMDRFADQSNTLYSNNKGRGIQTRLGTRFYGRNAPQEKGVTPFVELNWLHNSMDSSVYLNRNNVESSIGKDVAELKLGVQGELSENFSVWGHISGQQGSSDFRRNEIQLGIGYRW